jgi:hypothetical protein
MERELSCIFTSSLDDKSPYHFLAYVPYFKKESRPKRLPCRLCLCIPPPRLLNTWTNLYEAWYVYHAIWASLIGVPPISLCVCLCIPIIPRHRLGKHVPTATNTHNRIVGRVVFCAFRVIWKSLSLLGSGSVNTFPRQGKIVRGVVFYVVRVVSKESRRLVLPRISCLKSVE